MARLNFYAYGNHNNLYGSFKHNKKLKIRVNISFDTGVAEVVSVSRKELISRTAIFKLVEELDKFDFTPSESVWVLIPSKETN